MPGLFQLRHQGRLVGGAHVAMDLVDAQARGDRMRGPLAVAGGHHDAQPARAQRAQRLRRAGLDRIGHRDAAGGCAIDRKEHHAAAFLAGAAGMRLQRLHRDPFLLHQHGIAERQPVAVDTAAHADAAAGFEILGR